MWKKQTNRELADPATEAFGCGRSDTSHLGGLVLQRM